MICIDVKDYCSECMDFEPDIEKPQKFYGMGNEICVTDTIIRCENRKRCEQIKRYLEREVTGDGFNETGGKM